MLDEPSAGVDPRARRTLLNLLRGLPQTTLISTHDMRLVAELLPRTGVMDDGRVVADGLTDAVMEDADLLEARGMELPSRRLPSPPVPIATSAALELQTAAFSSARASFSAA